MRRCLLFTLIFTFIYSINPHAFGCSIFVASKNGKTIAGNNEDFIDPNTSCWFMPAENGKHGRVYFGFRVGFPQGGMNDQGLFFDYAALPPSPDYVPPVK